MAATDGIFSGSGSTRHWTSAKKKPFFMVEISICTKKNTKDLTIEN